MPISKVADRGTTAGNTSLNGFRQTLTGLTVGNYLIARVSAENSGGGGAARTLSVVNGGVDGSVFNNADVVILSQNYDPGAAGAGVTGHLVYVKITGTGGTVDFLFSGTVRVAIVTEEWTGIHATSPVRLAIAWQTGTVGAVVQSFSGHQAGDLLYKFLAVEGPDADSYTEDTDTLEGSWQTLTGTGGTAATATDNQAIRGSYKIPTGTSNQSHTATFTNRDVVSGRIAFAVAPTTLGRVKTSAGVSKPTKIFPGAVTKPVKALTSSGWKTLP